MRELSQRFYTPTELDKMHILSNVTQWKLRSEGKLRYFKIGRKILYSQTHLDEFFASSECKGAEARAA